jgi:hypothetical protein
LVILYGVLATGFGILTAALLWSFGPFIALTAAILAGAFAIIGTAILRFVALTASARRKSLPDDSVHPGSTEHERHQSR